MKSIKTILLSCLLAAGVTTSCTNEMEESFQATDAYLKVEASVDGITRAAIDATKFSEGDAIGLFVRDTEGNAYSTTLNCSNIKATYNGDVWDIATKFPLNKDKEAVVYAYYPYNANINIVGDSIDIDVTNQDDILYGNATGVTYENQTAKIQFNHALARVSLAITKGTNDVEGGVVSYVSLRNGPKYLKDNSGLIPTGTSDYISLQGRMSLKDGIIKRTPAVESVVTVNPQLTLSETTQNVDVLLIPCGSLVHISTDVSSAEIVLTIDGNRFKKSISHPYWVRGNQYVYPMTINRTLNSNNRPAEKIYMGFDGDNGKPLYWASYNLGASQPYEDGGLYGWGDPTGTHTEQWDNEYYGNYVTEEIGIQYYGGTNPPYNISGTDYDVARALWGDGWRIPSQNEFKKLKEYCYYGEVTRNGVKGYEFESISNRNNKIFIPVSKNRIGNKVYDSTVGTYWCNESMMSEGYAKVVFCPHFDHRGVSVCSGFPIRPVTE